MSIYSVCIKLILVSLAIVSRISLADDDISRLRGKCRDYKKIPFAITNIAADDAGNGRVEYGFSSYGAPNKLFFLKDVVYCDPLRAYYSITGTKLSENQFKEEVEKYMNSSTLNHVLYNIHGFQTSPYDSFMGASKWNEEHSTYLVIPIQWRNAWEFHVVSYEYDRNNNAPKIGELLASHFDVFKASYKTSILCHSMGNWAFRVFAQNIEDPSVVFHNFFAVAADARMDMFGTDFNPKAEDEPTSDAYKFIEVDRSGEPSYNYDLEKNLGIPPEELKKNGGWSITKISKNSHVIYNQNDDMLSVRELFQIGWGKYVRRALGRYGKESEDLMTLEYFKKRVKYHNFSEKVVEQHSYNWEPVCAELYILYENTDVEIDISIPNNQEKINISAQMGSEIY